MTTYNADIKTKTVAGGYENIVERGLINTPVKVIQERVSPILASVEVGNHIYKLESPPKYATIKNIIVYVPATLGTGTTFDVGDGETSDRYIDGFVGTSPNRYEILSSNHANKFYHTGQVDGDEQLQIQILGTVTGAVELLIEIEYTS